MKIVDKQTIRVPVILSIALIIFSMIVFSFFSYFRKQELTAYLQVSAINRARFIFDKKMEISKFRDLDKDLNESAYLQQQFTFYDSLGNVLYKSTNAVPHLNPELLKKVLTKKIFLDKEGFERIFFSNRENNSRKLYVFEASAYDIAGFDKQKKLLYMLIISTCSLIGLIVFISRYYIGKDLKPISKIVKQMELISNKNLHERLPEAKLHNEIGQMSQTFNELLDRVETAYSQQLNFVSYATHELRTPLAILLGNAQVTLMKERSKEEYIKTVENFQFDINNMNKLVTSLLELARMNGSAQAVPFRPCRVDELLWQASDLLKNKHSDYTIHINFSEIPDNENLMTIDGSADLLILVFKNLMENACKYSENHKVEVIILIKNKAINLQFIDTGVGISAKEIEHIFEAFYRTEKTNEISGHGVGLPLCKRILDIHQGKITVKSVENEGTIFEVILPILNVESIR